VGESFDLDWFDSEGGVTRGPVFVEDVAVLSVVVVD